ncbi:MAG TPA: VOC family protein [Actinomycetota bacterium]|nr:VOC family protein [Actinomycetota bacterium]
MQLVRPSSPQRTLEGLGAERVREPEPDEDFVVLSDPEGNLFCVIDKSDTGGDT